MQLPISDAHGASLISFTALDESSPEEIDPAVRPIFCVVVVISSAGVLLGFHLSRQQWELPGGTLDVGELAYDAAVRELAEETGIMVDGLVLVARALFTLPDQTGVAADVFAVALDESPELIDNDELNQFVWWDPASDVWEGLSPIDAEIARRCLPHNRKDVN